MFIFVSSRRDAEFLEAKIQPQRVTGVVVGLVMGARGLARRPQ